MDDDQTYVTDGIYLFGVNEFINLYYLMGILNSKLFVFVYRLLTLEKGRVLPQVKPTILSNLPIRAIDFKNSEESSQHDKMVNLVMRMMDLQSKLASTKMPHTKTTIQRQIDATDHQIDKLVYKLYNLTDNEIEIVESNTI